MIARVSDTAYQRNISEKTAAYTPFISFLVDSVFIFNKSIEEEKHIMMKSTDLHHCVPFLKTLPSFSWSVLGTGALLCVYSVCPFHVQAGTTGVHYISI